MQRDLLFIAASAGCFAAVFVFLASDGRAAVYREFSWVAEQCLTASAFLAGVSTAQIQSHYRSDAASSRPSRLQSESKVKILIVPGHEPDAGGTVFDGVHERDLVVDIANELEQLLTTNPHYDSVVARTEKAWRPTLQSYFDEEATTIIKFQKTQTARMESLVAKGSISKAVEQVYHNTATGTARFHLYGINKWANEEQYDIVLHLHINDYGGRRQGRVGTYDGFTIYVPDHQYSNAAASKAVGDAIAVRLNAYHATSTMPIEDGGVAEDQDLIATGANNSANAAAVLIEYGYIYEPQFRHASTWQIAAADYAYQTYLGLQDFFKDPVGDSRGSIAFPYPWDEVNGHSDEEGAGIYALQAALHHLGYYPPALDTFTDCPISGKVGSCTQAGIKTYQRARGLETTGMLGPKTRAALEKDFENRQVTPI